MGILDLETLLPKILDKSFELASRPRRHPVDGGRRPSAEVRQAQEPQAGARADRSIERHPQRSHGPEARRAVFGCQHGCALRRIALDHHAGIRSTMSVPLMHGNKLWGSCTSTRRSRPTPLPKKICSSSTRSPTRPRSPSRTPASPRRSRKRPRRAQFQRLLFAQARRAAGLRSAPPRKSRRAARSHHALFRYPRLHCHVGKGQITEIVAMLNEYFEAWSTSRSAGTAPSTKYVGDELIGLFGAPVALEDAALARRAVPIDMQAAARLQPRPSE